MKRLITMLAVICFGTVVYAQSPLTNYMLPGKGIKQHDFIYTGEMDSRKPQAQSNFLVRGGKVTWQYSIPLRTALGRIQEIDDVTLLSNGNVVYACMTGAAVVTPEKNIIWQYVCEPGTETHSCQPIGKDSVLMVLNGPVGKVLIFNTQTNKLLKEIIIPTSNKETHMQFRHVRITPGKKSIMVGLIAEKKVVEFDLDGKELWSANASSAFSAVRLKNGNTLLSGDGEAYTREINSKGETVWEFNKSDALFKIGNTQTAQRLANGNTIICNWIPAAAAKPADWPGTVQAFEVTPDKKIVWALSAWDNPDLGPATSIQILNEPGNADDGELQR